MLRTPLASSVRTKKQTLGHFSEYLLLCSAEECKRFGMIWGWVNDYVFIFGWTVSLNSVDYTGINSCAYIYTHILAFKSLGPVCFFLFFFRFNCMYLIKDAAKQYIYIFLQFKITVLYWHFKMECIPVMQSWFFSNQNQKELYCQVCLLTQEIKYRHSADTINEENNKL